MMLPTGHTRNNFSLIEILMVTGLIAVVMGLAAVSFSGVTAEGRFRHGVNALVKYIDTMRHRAIVLQKPLRLVYDIPNNTYWAELLPAQRETMSDDEIEQLRLLSQNLPSEMVFEEIQLGPNEAESTEAISFDIAPDGMVANHHIYVRRGDYSARIEVYAVSGLVEVVSVENGERLADNWHEPALGDD